MTCRHETCEEPKASGRIYCEEHYWQWRRPDHDLHKANRLAHEVARRFLAHRQASREYGDGSLAQWKAAQQLGRAADQYKAHMGAADG